MKLINATQLEIDWELDTLISTVARKSQTKALLKTAFSKAMLETKAHELALGTHDRVTSFIRSTVKSDDIAHNERMKQTLVLTTQSKSTEIILFHHFFSYSFRCRSLAFS